MNTGRAGCWFIPSERIVMIRWARAQQPTTWRVLWARIVKGLAMIVTTEHARYRLDEEARGQFRLTVLEWLGGDALYRPCLTGRYATHGVTRLPVGHTGLVQGRVSIRIGGQFIFDTRKNCQVTDPCCGFSNRIVAIEP